MPSSIRFAKIRKQLEGTGYRLVRVRGSHHIFDRPGGPLVSIPVHDNKVKPFYAKQVAKIIAADEARRAGASSDKPAEGQEPKDQRQAD